jgi:hypothetical protein
LNLKADIPIQLPFGTKYFKIKPFLDIGYFMSSNVQAQKRSLADEFYVSGGFMLDIWDGAAGVYFPLIHTQNLDRNVKSFSGSNFFRQITFSFNLERLRIDKLAKEVMGF